jgi:predicted RNase H-like nuclease
MPGTVLGVDGCRAGWVGALLWSEDTPPHTSHHPTYDVLVAADIATLVGAALRRAPGLELVAIDIPIGLPDHRPRRTDRLARARLPRGRKSSVFSTPSRAASEQTTHPEASATNRQALGVGVSIQAFHLLPKILDVDEYARAGPPVRLLEAHPEVSFAALDPGCVVGSKRTRAGRDARRAALRRVELDPPAFRPGHGYAADDLLDACVVAWTARRHDEGAALCLPDPPEVFSDGIPAAIWV